MKGILKIKSTNNDTFSLNAYGQFWCVSVLLQLDKL